MNRKIPRRLLAAILVMLTVLAVAAPAMAATRIYATTKTNVRSGPSSSYSIIGVLEKGEVATKLGTSGSWTKIEYGNKTGYVNTSYVKIYTGDDDEIIIIGDEDSTTMYATGAVNVRTGPGTNYSKIGELSKGDTVRKVGVTGSWTIIDWGSGTAYVSSSYLSSSGGSSSGGTSSNTMVATANVNVRSGPSTSYSIVGSLAKGATITRTGTSGSWTKVSYSGRTAYVHSAYLAVYSGGSGSGKTLVYAKVDTEVRTGPGSSYRIMGYLDPGQSLEYVGLSGSYWYKVKYSSGYGYVYGPDMWFESDNSDVNASGGLVFAKSSSRVYKGPGTSYGSLGYLYAGESARRTGTVSSWTQISFEGNTGYIQTSRLTLVTGTGSYSMSTLNRYMFSISSRVYAYSVPVALSTYRLGTLSKNEAVWCMAGNSYWTKVLIDETIMYVQTDELSKTYSGSSSSVGSGSSNPSYYKGGTRLYVAKWGGADTYASTLRDEYIASGETDPYGEISRGTRLTVQYQIGSLVLVNWEDDRDGKSGTRTAFVDVDRVSTTRP